MWAQIVLGIFGVLAVGAVAVVIYDLMQSGHAVTRNFPIIGHLRYMLEGIGPELRQYIVTNNDAELPFSRDQRRWVYASAKGTNALFGFGTDNDIEHLDHYLIIKHAAFPLNAPLDEPSSPDPAVALPCAKLLGGSRGRAQAFRAPSIVNISGMSFGSLSAHAVEAMNRGAAEAGCLHNTGEGAISPHHLHGGDLIYQIGTSYFGCRDDRGHFDLARLVDRCQVNPVRAIEIKLSQGAKPGIGGLLPAAKVTPEIAQIRGIPVGVECRSPAAHSAFDSVDSMLDFVETLADATGLPVGIKSAVGEMAFWDELAEAMATDRARGVDFITVDGGEGGTGAAPLPFADHVAFPFKWAFATVYRAFAERSIQDAVVFIGSGKLGLPDNALLAMALGCDMVNVGREVMFAAGCIQSQRCHTGRCPTGVATQSQRLQRGLVPEPKGHRVATYVAALRTELLRISRACGHVHPGLVPPDALEILQTGYRAVSAQELFSYKEGWGVPSADQQESLAACWPPLASTNLEPPGT